MSSLENDLNLHKYLLKKREGCIRKAGTPPDDGKSILFIVVVIVLFYFIFFDFSK